ncbi:MAG: DUF1349 domain-containing protein [Lactobacillaceae bacterium]
MDSYSWINQPHKFVEDTDKMIIYTEHNTDMWQRTHYGMISDNAPMYLLDVSDKRFTYEVETKFDTNYLFDQCGIMIYLNETNWAKFSSEYENDEFQRLGGVVTKNGYSDWSTQDIPANVKNIHYQVKREGNDFIVEYAFNDGDFHQMRIFNLAGGNEFSLIKIGIYSASPQGRGFKAEFVQPHFL